MADFPSLVERLHDLETSAVNNIERLQDFHVFTGHNYDRYSKMVEAGHLTGSVTNVRTNSTLDVSDLAARLLKYLDDDLPRVVIYQVVSEFEDFFFEFLKLFVRNNTQALSQQRELKVKDVLDRPDMEQLIEFLIQKELHELRYNNVQAWFTYLKRVINLHSIKPEDSVRIAELKATRDVFAHNQGIANDIYVGKAGDLARAQPGQQLTLSRPYLYGSSDYLKSLVSKLTEEACSRLAK
jgi:hypothetical protein